MAQNSWKSQLLRFDLKNPTLEQAAKQTLTWIGTHENSISYRMQETGHKSGYETLNRQYNGRHTVAASRAGSAPLVDKPPHKDTCMEFPARKHRHKKRNSQRLHADSQSRTKIEYECIPPVQCKWNGLDNEYVHSRWGCLVEERAKVDLRKGCMRLHEINRTQNKHGINEKKQNRWDQWIENLRS